MDEFILPVSSTSSITSAGDQPHHGMASFLVEPERSFSTTESPAEGESASASASASVSGAPPGDGEEEADLVAKASVAHGSRPVSRFGFHRHGFYKRKPKLYPSSLVVNAQRVEAIFTRHYREPVVPEEKKEREKRPIRRTHLDPDQLEDLEDALGVKDRRAQAAGAASTPAGHAAAPGAGQEQDTEPAAAKEQETTTTTRRETRRATRSTGKGLDDWLKIPVSATVKVATGNLETLDGIVYVNVENGRLFKQQGRVYFETIWQGNQYKFFITDTELPMISEDHPAFKEELARIEEERSKKVTQAKHMLDLIKAGEEATFDIEKGAADRTLEFRRQELRERMLDRVDDKLEDLEEEAAIKSLESIMKTPASQLLRPSTSSASSIASSTTSTRKRGTTTTTTGTGATPERRSSRKSKRGRQGISSSTSSLSQEENPLPPPPAPPTPAVEVIVLDGDDENDKVETNVNERVATATSMSAEKKRSSSQDKGTATEERGGQQQDEMEQGRDQEHSQSTCSSPSRGAKSGQMNGGGSSSNSSSKADTHTHAAGAVPAATPTAGQEEEVEDGNNTENKPKKRKFNAADLAICTLAIASDISKGLGETGYVRDNEYEDIHEVVVDKLHPDEDWGEDEDLMAMY